MANNFHDEDLLEEFNGVPEFLHASKEAVRWFCQALIRVRLKRCGREELAWLFGIPDDALTDALPSSADAALFGESLLDIGFLPRKAGCMITGCRSSAHLNGRKCTLCKDLRDGATHALVIVEGGTGEELGTEELDKTIMIARKNLELASAPECHGEDGFPALTILAVPIEEDRDCLRPPSEVLGAAWHEPSLLPEHLRGGDGLVWLAGVVSRLMDSKSCGSEEIAYLLDLGKLRSLGEVPASITTEQQGSLLEALAFVPSGYWCTVEGCNSYAHLNGRKVQLCQDCPDGQSYAKIGLGEEGDLQMHRKNLRLLGTERSPPVSRPEGPEGGTGESPLTVLQELEGPPSRHVGGTAVKDNAPPASSTEETNGFISWLFGFSEAPAFWCGGSQQVQREQARGGCSGCCRRGDSSKETGVMKEEVTRYPIQCEQSPLDGMHPSFGPDAAQSSAASKQQSATARPSDSKAAAPVNAVQPGNVSGSSAPAVSLTEKLQKVVELRTKSQLTESEFRKVKEQLLSAGSQQLLEEVQKLAAMQSEGWLTTEEFGCAKAQLLSAGSY